MRHHNGRQHDPIKVFQYRKRYEVTCDHIDQRVREERSGFNTASGMRSHATVSKRSCLYRAIGFNTASGMRSHVTRRKYSKCSKNEVSIPQAV